MPPHERSHRKTVKRFHRPGDFHEFTFSTYRRLPVLEGDDRLRSLSRRIDDANREFAFQLVAFVFMPEHLHLLVFPTNPEPNLALYLARIKQPFSKDVKAEWERVNSPMLSTFTGTARQDVLPFLAGRGRLRLKPVDSIGSRGCDRVHSKQSGSRRRMPEVDGLEVVIGTMVCCQRARRDRPRCADLTGVANGLDGLRVEGPNVFRTLGNGQWLGSRRAKADAPLADISGSRWPFTGGVSGTQKRLCFLIKCDMEPNRQCHPPVRRSPTISLPLVPASRREFFRRGGHQTATGN